MAVRAGSKVQIRQGCSLDFIDNSQLVTLKEDPFILGGLVCVTIEEHDGIYCLDQFSEPGQEGPAKPANGEELVKEVSLEAGEKILGALDELAQAVAKGSERMRASMAQAAADLEKQGPKVRNRQQAFNQRRNRRRR